MISVKDNGENTLEKPFLCGSLGQLKVADYIPCYSLNGPSGEVECYGEMWPEIPVTV